MSETADFIMSKKREVFGNSEFDKIKNEELILQYESLSPSEQELLILDNCRLVFQEAYRFSNGKELLREELMSIGMVALQKAFMHFDPTKKIKFITFAQRCIDNEIFMYLRKFNKQKLELELDAPLMNQDDDKITYLEAIQLLQKFSMDESDMINAIYQQDLLENIHEIMESLSPMDTYILNSSFGLNGEEKMTQRDIAAELSISQSYVSRKQKKLVKKIQKTLKNNYDAGEE